MEKEKEGLQFVVKRPYWMKEVQTSEMLVCFTCSRLWITTSEQHLNCHNFLLKVL